MGNPYCPTCGSVVGIERAEDLKRRSEARESAYLEGYLISCREAVAAIDASIQFAPMACREAMLLARAALVGGEK